MINLLEVAISNPENTSDYPFCTPLFEQGFRIRFNKNITFIVGDNGVGKSTLLESLAIKIGFPPTGGSADHISAYSNLSRALTYSQGSQMKTFDELMANSEGDEHAFDNLSLAKDIRLTWRLRTRRGMFLRSETFIAFAGIGRYNASNMSHGEGILQVLKSINDDGVYIFDEPEAGLSPSKCLEFLSVMQDKVDDYNAQFIISTHSPIFIAYPSSELFLLTPSSIEPTNYSDTTHFRLAKKILADPEGFFEHFAKLKS